jgi:hypothetical protein
MIIFTITEQDDDTALWQPVKDPQKILEAESVVFGEDEKEILNKITALYPTDNFPHLTQRVTLSYSNSYAHHRISGTSEYANRITVQLNPKIQIDPHHLHKDEYFQEFCQYIKENGPYNFDDNMYYPFTQLYKHRLNDYGIYVRPVKKILEYNPKLAKAQIQNKTQKKKKFKEKTTRDDLRQLTYDLENFLNTGNKILFRRGYAIDSTKKDLPGYILCLISLFQRIVIPSTGYRKLKSFQCIRNCWNPDDFPENFNKFMETELKKRKPKVQDINPKPNKKFFKLYYADVIDK